MAELLLNHTTSWDNGTLIYLGVKSEQQLKNWIKRLERNFIDVAVWKEPDMGNQITAVAAYSEEKVFKNLNCL